MVRYHRHRLSGAPFAVLALVVGLALTSAPATAQTATVEGRVTTAETGDPVEGAQVHLWPNVHWACGFSNIFLDQTWSAATDVRGSALVLNVPGGCGTFGDVGSAPYSIDQVGSAPYSIDQAAV